jgi:predicted membrane protein
MAENNDKKRLWLGIIFFLIGGMLLLDNLNIFYFHLPHYIFSWKSLLILIGLYFIFGRDKKGPGVILLTIGTVFLLEDILWWLHFDFWDLFLPGILIFLGAALVMRKSTNNKPADADEVDYLDDMAVFGGGEKKITSQNFKGGRITAVFGGSKINMSQADIADGQPVLDVFAMFGGTDIIVPPDWTIKTEVIAIFGGFSDKRQTALTVVHNVDKVLTIKGLVLFGGGEVKSL